MRNHTLHSTPQSLHMQATDAKNRDTSIMVGPVFKGITNLNERDKHHFTAHTLHSALTPHTRLTHSTRKQNFGVY